MSHSYKKKPIIQEKSSCKKRKLRKATANRKVRKLLKKDLELNCNNKDYKKYFESYDVNDYILLYTEEQAKADYEKWTNPNSTEYDKFFIKKFPTLESYMFWWKKTYIGK